MVSKEIGIPVDQSIFWTDSTCVLGYIANKDKRFHAFVANSVAAIHEITSPPQWKHVGTKQNPANDPSCGLTAESLLKNKRWVRGPDFLWKSEDAWPSQQCLVSMVAENDPEVKRESLVLSTKAEAGSTLGQFFGCLSKWHRLKKFVAWILRYRANLRRAVERSKSGPLPLKKAPRIEPITGVFRKEDGYTRRRWRQVQYLSDVFWCRWLKEYLPSLQERQKWTRSTVNFEVGDVILVVDENSPRNLWPFGRIQEVKPKKGDGLVRRVALKTKTSVLERPINKIVLLEASRLHDGS